jgi:hypothetical protein
MDRTAEAYPNLNKLPIKRFAPSDDMTGGGPGGVAV